MTYLDFAILSILAFCVVRNENPLRFWVAYSLLIVMAVNIGLFYTSFFEAAVEALGFHVYQSLYHVAFIALLALRPSKLAFLMIGVSILAIFVNMLSYWVDISGDSTVMFVVLMWGLFAVQVALLLSKRLTNGVYGSLTSPRILRRFSNPGINNLLKGKG
jgi:hypothetical protein